MGKIVNNMQKLRSLIREIIKEMAAPTKEDDVAHPASTLLTEPDDPSGDEDTSSAEVEEVSGVSAIAGVTTPLGTGPTYPDKKGKKKKLRKGWQKSK